jgi:hypothetical protein
MVLTVPTGTNTEANFSVTFFGAREDDFPRINSYTASSYEMGPFPSNILLSLAIGGSGDFSSVGAMELSWAGGSAANLSFLDVVALSGPSGGFFTASAPGGVRFINSANLLTADPADPASGYWPAAALLPPGATSWSATSDSNAKTDVTAVDHREILREVAALPVTAWHYKHDPSRRYVGPMAQDFRQTFGLGSDDKRISTLDTDGVTLSAIKGLIEELRERKERSAEQARRLAELEAELRALGEQIRSNLPPGE